MHDELLYELRGSVATITLNRPEKRNALTRELIAGLTAAIERIAADVADDPASIRVVQLRAAGPVFCAGMDLAEMEQRAAQPDAAELWAADTRAYRELTVSLATLPIPAIAVVQGPAVAGGLGLVLACDLVLAAEAAFFSLPEPQRGITAAIVTPLLTYRVGVSAASWLLLSGERIAADRGLQIGLCHQLRPADALPARADELSNSVIAGAPGALATTKRHLLASAAPELIDKIDAAMPISATARESTEAREGLAAFLEKRPPAWR